MNSKEMYEKYRRSMIWAIAFAVVSLICLLLALFVFVGSALSEEDNCGVIKVWPSHQYCDGGTRTLYMCATENGGYFKTTCLGVPEYVEECTWRDGICYSPAPMPEIDLMHLPIVVNMRHLPTPAPTMTP